VLKINVSKNIGFCFGVEKAVKTAEELLGRNEEVYITGDLIHNEEEMARLEKMGLKTLDIKKDTWPNLSHSTVLIRAHGVPMPILSTLKRKARRVVNATCPVVNNVARLIKEEKDNGYEILLFGREGHAEVEYLKSCVDDVKVVNLEKMLKLTFKDQKIALFSQTTMDMDGFKKMAEYILEHMKSFSDLHIHNTICSVTVKREEEVKRLAKSSDVCIIVGGRKSSNTRKLFEIAKKMNENSYMILNANEVKEKWFTSAKNVGICSGTSTPQKAIEGVIERLKKFKN
jgi:4-hydroxy-3-methylbut-2-enyl diphosphate reductase